LPGIALSLDWDLIDPSWCDAVQFDQQQLQMFDLALARE
jgi:hypothetical protein